MLQQSRPFGQTSGSKTLDGMLWGEFAKLKKSHQPQLVVRSYLTYKSPSTLRFIESHRPQSVDRSYPERNRHATRFDQFCGLDMNASTNCGWWDFAESLTLVGR